jgi:uncharacterized membrane protein YbhN (UPF0104 family)
MLLFAGVMFVPNRELLAAHPRLAALAAVTLAMLVACTAVVFLSFWGGMSRGWPTARLWLRRLPLGQTLERGLDACRACGQDRGFFWRALGYSMVLNVCCVAQFAAVAAGLGLDIPWRVLCLCVPTIICISALPITPSGLGVRENLYVLVLTVPEIGVSATQALSLSLLAYAGSLCWSLVGGAVYARGRRTYAIANVRQTEAAEAS